MHFKKGDLILIFIGSPGNIPYIIHSVERVNMIQSKHVSGHDVLYYRHDGTLGRVDIFHVFHAQDCYLPKCKNFFDWYISKK
jgi:plasmid stabilization system protein ParE